MERVTAVGREKWRLLSIVIVLRASARPSTIAPTQSRRNDVHSWISTTLSPFTRNQTLVPSLWRLSILQRRVKDKKIDVSSHLDGLAPSIRLSFSTAALDLFLAVRLGIRDADLAVGDLAVLERHEIFSYMS